MAGYVAWMKEQQGTREYLEEAERVMREQGVIRVADGGWRVADSRQNGKEPWYNFPTRLKMRYEGM